MRIMSILCVVAALICLLWSPASANSGQILQTWNYATVTHDTTLGVNNLIVSNPHYKVQFGVASPSMAFYGYVNEIVLVRWYYEDTDLAAKPGYGSWPNWIQLTDFDHTAGPDWAYTNSPAQIYSTNQDGLQNNLCAINCPPDSDMNVSGYAYVYIKCNYTLCEWTTQIVQQSQDSSCPNYRLCWKK